MIRFGAKTASHRSAAARVGRGRAPSVLCLQPLGSLLVFGELRVRALSFAHDSHGRQREYGAGQTVAAAYQPPPAAAHRGPALQKARGRNAFVITSITGRHGRTFVEARLPSRAGCLARVDGYAVPGRLADELSRRPPLRAW